MEMIIHFLQLRSAAFLGVRPHASGLCCSHPPSPGGFAVLSHTSGQALEGCAGTCGPSVSLCKSWLFPSEFTAVTQTLRLLVLESVFEEVLQT